MRLHFLIAGVAAAALLTSCSGGVGVRYGSVGGGVSTQPSHRHGPPPHAPAHGYRCKHSDGVELIFNKSINAYTVVGHTGVYFYRESYYREHGSSWEISAHIGGPWKVCSSGKVPKKLKKHGKKH